MKRRILTVMAAALIGVGMATACLPVQAQDARPMLRMSSGATDNATLDPARATSTNDVGVVSEIFSGLVRFPPGSADPKAMEPDLAERWETSADGKTWTFHLRHGVKFHGDWGEVQAEDVVYSLQRAADAKRSSFAAGYIVVDKVEAVDNYTVKVTLKYPDAGFLALVTNYHGGNIVSKKAAEKYGDQFGNNPVGTGPFAFAEHITQQYVKLVANDTYYRGKPKLAGIMYRMIPSDSARELAFSSGELDVIQGKREQRWVERTRKQGNAVLDIFRPGEFRTLYINRTIKPLDNVKVREAVAEAVNVDEILRYVGTDVASRGCSVVPPNYLGEDCASGAYPYNPDHARKLLAEAGFPNGITIKSVVSSISAQLPIMQVVQAQLGKAGIKLDMDVVDHATYQAQSRKDLSALVFYGAARYPEANNWLTEFYDSASAIGAPTAMSNFSHCTVADDDIRAARIEPDAQKQLALWKDAQKKIHADVCSIPLFDLLQVWVHSTKVNYGYELKGALNLAPPITENTTLAQ
jgi:peptide/nickel transport system substrate-binding protein